jgi:hypothetical protein
VTTKRIEICSRCGCEPLAGCVDGSIQTGSTNWSGCEQAGHAEREIWLAKTSVEGHNILAWDDVYQEAKNGSGRRFFVYARSAELGYTILRSLPRGKIRAVPTSQLHRKKKPKTTE